MDKLKTIKHESQQSTINNKRSVKPLNLSEKVTLSNSTGITSVFTPNKNMNTAPVSIFWSKVSR